jgi:Fur family ferric uptake transcriptional regulator
MKTGSAYGTFLKNRGDWKLQKTEKAWPAGVKKTRQRVCVLSVLERAGSPLSAAEIYRQLEQDSSPGWLSTVYRILELFVQKGVVLKTTVLDGEMAVYELNRNQHKHYAVCVNCHKMIQLDCCPLEKYCPEVENGEFRILGHKVEMYGYCKECDEKISRGGPSEK